MAKTPAVTEQMRVFEPRGRDTSLPGLVVMYAGGQEPMPGAFVLSKGENVIGREDGVDIVLNRQSISRRHASVLLEQGRWKVTDLGSRNGTILDGFLISESLIEAGAELRVGDVFFKFVESSAEQYEGYRFDGTMTPGTVRQARIATMLLGGAQMDRVVAELEKIATTGLSVILRGESGTGKEVAAREVHRLSDRKGQFVAVNCAAIPAPLLESELFGYRKGAFSGADRDKTGLIKAAHGGTLFLDEIGDMPLEAQAKLLRVLQSKEVTPIGATQPEVVDVRIICATHRDLRLAQQRGTFRGDLYARLQEYSVTLPALRDRKEDVYLLTQAFLARSGRNDLSVSIPFMVGLLHYDWPYNVRELEGCIKRAIALTHNNVLDSQQLPESILEVMANYGKKQTASVRAEQLRAQQQAYAPAPIQGVPPQYQPAAPGTPLPERVSANAPTQDELRALLVQHQGNVAAVARVLGKERAQIHRWMRKYGLDASDFRGYTPVTQSAHQGYAPVAPGTVVAEQGGQNSGPWPPGGGKPNE